MNYFGVVLCWLCLLPQLCQSQADVPLTEPQLVSISPVNSTALTVVWQFASSAIDQSDLIRVSISFFEFYYNYNGSAIVNNYTFTTANKTQTSLTKNFDLVNAFYYVCFQSNSTRTNATRFVYASNCMFTRTCLRANSSSPCPPASLAMISATDVTSSGFVINIHWLKNLPYVRNTSSVALTNGSSQGTALSAVDNGTFTTVPYRFSGLQSSTTYVVNTSVTYTLLGSSLAEMRTLSVMTSRSSFHSGDVFLSVAVSVLFYFCNK